MKRIIIRLLVLAAAIFLIIFIYNMATFTQGVVDDANNEDLKIKGTVKEGVLLIPEDTFKVIQNNHPSN